jgi:hypothetical protein
VTLKTAISAEHAEAYGSMPSFVLIAEMCFNIGWRRLAQAVSRHKQSDMEVMSFLKAVPAVIGIAGLLTYFVRARTVSSGFARLQHCRDPSRRRRSRWENIATTQ